MIEVDVIEIIEDDEAPRAEGPMLATVASTAADKAAGAVRVVVAAAAATAVGAGRPSSRALGRALEAAATCARTEPLRTTSSRGMRPSRARRANGVFLPASRTTSNPALARAHSTLHTRTYYDTINQMLGAATSRAEAEAALGWIRAALLIGGL